MLEVEVLRACSALLPQTCWYVAQDDGRTALHDAAENDQATVLEILLNYGADPLKKTKVPTFLHIICMHT